MITIGNGSWTARIAEAGAELKSLVHAETGREHIWHGDPAWWNGSAPVLFPVIGGLRGGEYRHGGRTWRLPSHGFARGSTFTVVRSSAEAAELELASCAATREVYPFEFTLTVSFALERSGIRVGYAVHNRGSSPMLFSLGSHPAFVVPFAGGVLENYYILFEKEEELERLFLADGTIVAGKTAEVLDNRRVLSLSRSVFDQGAIVFRRPASRWFALVNGRNSRAVRVVTDGVPFIGIWAKPGAPFVCIEPWHGLPDSSDFTGELAQKEGIISLEPGGRFVTGYRVEVS